ncbi:hypothetical protein H5410_062082 [Solanum commersonii]|uniref:Uncharacterized protein n=1 Tax=Solanum commersonii TaxID=4109 RepID=A0A9J5WAK8_SOLCO|nr:hypothetical protein H5410_062082 [Solanum commersonii]
MLSDSSIFVSSIFRVVNRILFIVPVVPLLVLLLFFFLICFFYIIDFESLVVMVMMKIKVSPFNFSHLTLSF